jgi:putative transposase
MDTKGHCFPESIIIQAVYLKLHFAQSYRDVEEIMRIRGEEVDHATIQRWVYKFMPEIELQMRKRKKVIGKRWRMDETYIKVKGVWHYLYRAVDRDSPYAQEESAEYSRAKYV